MLAKRLDKNTGNFFITRRPQTNSSLESLNADDLKCKPRRSKQIARQLLEKKANKSSLSNKVDSSQTEDDDFTETPARKKKNSSPLKSKKSKSDPKNKKNTPPNESSKVKEKKSNSSISNQEEVNRQPTLQEVSASSSKIDKPETVLNSKVLVPSWREVPFKRGFGMEGTENVSDEIFAKRHQKYENEEKQIKKWDMQRQRAELERLKLLKSRTTTSCAANNKSSNLNKTSHDDENSNVTLNQSSNSFAGQLANEKPRNKKKIKSNSLEIYFKAPEQVNLDDIEFIEIVDEKDLKHIKIPTPSHTPKPITIETSNPAITTKPTTSVTPTTTTNTVSTTVAVIPAKQHDEHTANVITSSSDQTQVTLSPKKQPKNSVIPSSKQTNAEPEFVSDDSTGKTLLNISNNHQTKSPAKSHLKKEQINATVTFKTETTKRTSNKENQSIRKVRSKSLCSEFENVNNEKNLKSAFFLNKSNSNIKAASMNEDFANLETHSKNKILTIFNNQQQNLGLKRKQTKQQQQYSPDRKRKRLNPE